MALAFEIYKGSLEDLGTVTELVGKKGTLAFIDKNLNTTMLNAKGVLKAVVVVLKKTDGTSETVACSQAISVSVRRALGNGIKKNKLLAIISKLSIVENDKGHNFISAPAGEQEGLEEFLIEDLTKVKEASYEDLLAF